MSAVDITQLKKCFVCKDLKECPPPRYNPNCIIGALEIVKDLNKEMTIIEMFIYQITHKLNDSQVC